MLVIIKRIFQSGIKNFKRQANLSWAASSVLVITISLISFLFLSHKILDFAISEIRAKADISVYFQQDCLEKEIFEIQERLTEFSEVKKLNIFQKSKPWKILLSGTWRKNI